jgi:hypothetical protein
MTNMYEFEIVPPEGTIRGPRRGLPLLLTTTSGLRDLQKEFLTRMSTLIKKKTKFYPYVRKFRRERLQSHIRGRAS